MEKVTLKLRTLFKMNLKQDGVLEYKNIQVGIHQRGTNIYEVFISWFDNEDELIEETTIFIKSINNKNKDDIEVIEESIIFYYDNYFKTNKVSYSFIKMKDGKINFIRKFGVIKLIHQIKMMKFNIEAEMMWRR